jgi:hypothetical protein
MPIAPCCTLVCSNVLWRKPWKYPVVTMVPVRYAASGIGILLEGADKPAKLRIRAIQ